MSTNKQIKEAVVKANILHAAFVLFTENGYTSTTVDSIFRLAGLSNKGVFFRAFPTKEAVLLELMPKVLSQQLTLATKLLGEHADDKVLWYAFDTAIEYNVVEASESLRDLYLAVYSLPDTSEYVYKMMAPKLQMIFKDFLPHYEEKDFYELDVASASIVRGYIAKKCDMYFTLATKIRKSVEATLRLFRVPEERIQRTIEIVLSMNITTDITEAIESLRASLRAKQ